MPKAKVKLLSRDKARKAKTPKLAKGQALMLLPDYGPAERWQHSIRTLHVDAETQQVAARALEECVLDTLKVAGLISGAMHTAGMKLRRDYTRAHIAPRQAARYQPGTGEKVQYREFTRSASEEEAYTEWREALLGAGVHSGDILVNVCCIGWLPTPADMQKLRDALQQLYRYYRARHSVAQPVL